MGRAWVCLLAALAISGCASARYVMDNYDVPKQEVTAADGLWSIFHNPNRKSLLTQPSIGRSLGIGAARGATLGLADPEPKVQAHTAAARQFLDEQGIACPITRTAEVIDASFEHFYAC